MWRTDLSERVSGRSVIVIKIKALTKTTWGVVLMVTGETPAHPYPYLTFKWGYHSDYSGVRQNFLDFLVNRFFAKIAIMVIGNKYLIYQ